MGNPIIKGQGVCDPHIRIYNDKAYLYATHDKSKNNSDFVMEDWQVWSSSDLINWKHESTLRPEDTYIGPGFKQCWATDAASKNGKYYWYFSQAARQTGVVVSDSPTGPWTDPLGKPLISSGPLTKYAYDCGIIIDDDGDAYVVFGRWDFYIAKLGQDMVSLTEAPRKIEIHNPQGPYGKDTTDDKPYLHKRGDLYYLSWGCFYATSKNIYGPYECKGSIVIDERVDEKLRYDPIEPIGDFKAPITYDRHGSFFEWNEQWFFVFNDMSCTKDSHYRDSSISYVHYRDNGDIEPIWITTCGVGQYDAQSPKIEAENYFKATGVNKKQSPEGGFEIRDIKNGSCLVFPNVKNITPNALLSLCIASANPNGATVEIRNDSPDGELLGSCKVVDTGGWDIYKTLKCNLKNSAGTKNIYFIFKGDEKELLRFNWFSFMLDE